MARSEVARVLVSVDEETPSFRIRSAITQPVDAGVAEA